MFSLIEFVCDRFYDKRDAEDALEAMDGRMLDGRELRVQMARYGRPSSPQTRRNGGSGDRGSGRRDRGRRLVFHMCDYIGISNCLTFVRSSRERRRSRSRSRGRRSFSRSRSRSESKSSRGRSASPVKKVSVSRSRSKGRSASRSAGSRSNSRD